MRGVTGTETAPYNDAPIECLKQAVNETLERAVYAEYIIPEWKQYYMPWYLEIQRTREHRKSVIARLFRVK